MNKKLKRQLLRGGAGSILVKVIFAASSFLISVTLARILGAEGFGLYSLVVAIVMLLSIPAVVGVPELVVRETAKNQAENRLDIIKGLWDWTLKRGLFSSIGVVVISILVMVIFFEGFENKIKYMVVIGLCIVPFMVIVAQKSACLRGLRYTVLGQLPDSIIRPGLMLVLLFYFQLTDYPLSAKDALFIYLSSVIISAVAVCIILNKLRPNELLYVEGSSSKVAIWKKSILPLSLIGGLHIFNGYIDIVVLGFFKSDEEVGIYRAVVQLSLLVSFGLQAINQVLHPYFSRLYVNNEHDSLQKLVTISTRLIFVISIIPVTLFLLFGSKLLTIIYGSPFYVGGMALSILAVGQLFNSAMGSVGALLNMTGNESYTLRGVIFSAVINVMLNFLLIPVYGMVGASIATAVSLIVWNILLRYYVRKKLNIEPSALFKLPTIKAKVN